MVHISEQRNCDTLYHFLKECFFSPFFLAGKNYFTQISLFKFIQGYNCLALFLSLTKSDTFIKLMFLVTFILIICPQFVLVVFHLHNVYLTNTLLIIITNSYLIIKVIELNVNTLLIDIILPALAHKVIYLVLLHITSAKVNQQF